MLSTWGAPLVGGAVSEGGLGFVRQFEIIDIFQVFSILLLVFGAPETAFNRPPSSRFQTSSPKWPGYANPFAEAPIHHPFSFAAVKRYLSENVKPCCYPGPALESYLLLQAAHALVAPTTVLVVLVSFLPLSALWGLSASLSLLFSPTPFNLLPSAVGAVMAAPALIAAVVVVIFTFRAWWLQSFDTAPMRLNATMIGSGTVLASVGILAFGLATAGSASSADNAGKPAISLGAVSFFLALLAAGVYVLDVSARPLVWRSAAFMSNDAAAMLRNTAHLSAGVSFWRSLLAGVFLIALPAALSLTSGLRSAAIGLGAAQIVLAGVVATLWWRYDENIRRLDGRVMGSMNSDMKRKGSFFDLD